MAPHNKPVTLSDIESRGGLPDVQLRCAAPGSNTTWSFSLGAWIVINVIANVIHPPVLVMLALNAGLLVFNMDLLRKAGRANTPPLLYIMVGLQGLITLQYGWYTASSLF